MKNKRIGFMNPIEPRTARSHKKHKNTARLFTAFASFGGLIKYQELMFGHCSLVANAV
jgi:hypothetical protein